MVITASSIMMIISSLPEETEKKKNHVNSLHLENTAWFLFYRLELKYVSVRKNKIELKSRSTDRLEARD